MTVSLSTMGKFDTRYESYEITVSQYPPVEGDIDDRFLKVKVCREFIKCKIGKTQKEVNVNDVLVKAEVEGRKFNVKIHKET